jgi:hypothetical protein
VDSSLRALLDGLIDYAGLFPPAALDLDRALDEYLAHRRGPYASVLGRFVVPVDRLGALGDALAARRAEVRAAPVPVSAILRREDDPTVALDAWAADGASVASFAARAAAVAVVESVEAPLPPSIASTARAAEVEAFFEEAAGRCAPCRALPVFWERSLLGAPRREAFEALANALATTSARRRGAGLPAWGLKLRCGGVTASAFPPAADLAAAVAVALGRAVPFKATAGLHHPLPRWDERLGVNRHGFLNLFVGAVLVSAGVLGEESLGDLLADAAPDSFRFHGGAVAWRGIAVDATTVRRVRVELVRSFGSCSVDEPLEDLAALGLLGR